jgi:hypothetical protein
VSLIKKTDVKNHLSAGYRTKIHLQPKSQRKASGSAREEPVAVDQEEKDSMENSLRLSSTGGRKPIALVTRKSVQN